MKFNYKIIIIVVAIILVGVGIYYYKKENYADQVMHWYAGGIAGPVITPESVYGVPQKVKFMERESY